ncbi:MAG: CoA transferase [Lachnospiraceae bacterium]|jgi:crotonobetainyl-CoA:carnitine CoA-transferase CaiB-like acyl-CoA transferase|nr:CoA transferase [Lachnospiraceae bacterium]
MKPLEGITIVELSTYIAAPSCGRVLATQGARVIKVESPAGDIERKFGPTLFCPATDEENPIYDTLNGGKEAVMLNLKDSRHMEQFHKLLEKADVFITNNRIQALKKMGLDYDSLKERYPKLIYAILLGYGEKGPKVNFPGFDAIAMFATGGFIQDMMVEAPGAYPIYLPMGFGDLICGTVLAGAIGTALYGREKSGKGDYVSLSLHGAAMWMFSIMSTGTQFGYQWPRGRYQGGPMGVPYKTKDNRWILPVVNEYERYWKSFCHAVGAEEIIDDPRFCTKQATFDPKNREDCIRYFENCFLKLNADEVLPKLEAADIIVSELAHFKDNHTSEQALANGFISPITYPNGDEITLAMPPVKMGSIEPPKAERAHSIGADNERVFKDFGIEL